MHFCDGLCKNESNITITCFISSCCKNKLGKLISVQVGVDLMETFVTSNLTVLYNGEFLFNEVYNRNLFNFNTNFLYEYIIY